TAVVACAPQWAQRRNECSPPSQGGVALPAGPTRKLPPTFCVSTRADLASKLEKMEKKLGEHDQHFQVVFEAIKELMALPPWCGRFSASARYAEKQQHRCSAIVARDPDLIE